MTKHGVKDYKYKTYEEREISVYKNFNSGLWAENTKPFYRRTHSLTIKQVYEVVKNGGGIHDIEDIKEKIRFIQTHSKCESEFIKKSLPSFTASANFEGVKSKSANKTYTQLLGFDFDKLTPEQAEQALQALKQWEGTMLLFRSPSGNGVKLFVCVKSPEAQHERVYRCLARYLKETLSLDADMQCVDVTRLCFFSHDPDAYYNSEVKDIDPSELFKAYKDIANEPDASYQGIAVDYTAVDTKDIKTIYHGMADQLMAKGVEWVDGKRNAFLLEICKVKKWGITFEQCLSETMELVNGRYTSDYTKHTIPQKLAYNWQRYFNGYMVFRQPAKPCMQIENYLTEQKEFINAELLAKRILFIDAPTGAGKTTLIKQLAKELKLKTDILMPTTALVEQQTDIVGITGNKALSAEQVKADVLACCYNSIGKIQDRSSKLLVIDEAHSLVSDYGYKHKTIKEMQRHLDRYEYIIYLSGSMLTLDGYYSEENHLRFEKRNRFEYEYQIIELEAGFTDKDYFISGIDKTKLNVFYQNDKTVLDNLYAYLTSEGYKVAYVSRDKKDEEEYQGIVKNSSLVGYDVLLTTCVIQAGVNITDCDREAVITFGRRSNLIDYIQFTARFRKRRPQVRIIHSNRMGALWVSDKSSLLDRIEIEKQLLEKAREKNQSRIVDFDYLEAESIIKGIDMVFEDFDGNYITDSFRLLYEDYQTLTKNVNSNVRVLRHYLSQFHFTETACTTIQVEDAKMKGLKGVGRNNSAEKKRKTERVINSILSGNHTFQEEKDKVTQEIESRYQFLSKYLTNKDISERRKLLTSKPKFDEYKSKVVYVLAEKDIRAQKQVADRVLLEFAMLRKLAGKIKENHTYSGCDLKQMLKEIGFDISGNGFVNKSLGLLYDFERTANGTAYKVKGRIKESDLITKKRSVEPVTEEGLFS